VDSVKGVGVKKAIKLVEENESLEKVVECLKKDPKLGDKVP
jgi:5'-3' exonuclease